MKFLSDLIKYFAYITTAILIVCAVSAWGSTLTYAMLWRILFAGAATALVTAVFFNWETRSKGGMIALLVMHFLILCAMMIAIGFWFRWIPRNGMGALMMVLDVVLVYAFTALSYYLTSRKEIAELNQALKEKYKDSESK